MTELSDIIDISDDNQSTDSNGSDDSYHDDYQSSKVNKKKKKKIIKIKHQDNDNFNESLTSSMLFQIVILGKRTKLSSCLQRLYLSLSSNDKYNVIADILCLICECAGFKQSCITHDIINEEHDSVKYHSDSPPEITTTVSTRRGASSNYLSLKSRATPGDRGGDEGDEDDVTSSGQPGRTKNVAPKNRNSTRKNRNNIPGGTKSVNPEEQTSSIVDVTSSGEPAADLREAEGEVKGGGLHGEWTTSGGTASGKDRIVTSDGHDDIDDLTIDSFNWFYLSDCFNRELDIRKFNLDDDLCKLLPSFDLELLSSRILPDSGNILKDKKCISWKFYKFCMDRIKRLTKFLIINDGMGININSKSITFQRFKEFFYKLIYNVPLNYIKDLILLLQWIFTMGLCGYRSIRLLSTIACNEIIKGILDRIQLLIKDEHIYIKQFNIEFNIEKNIIKNKRKYGDSMNNGVEKSSRNKDVNGINNNNYNCKDISSSTIELWNRLWLTRMSNVVLNKFLLVIFNINYTTKLSDVLIDIRIITAYTLLNCIMFYKKFYPIKYYMGLCMEMVPIGDEMTRVLLLRVVYINDIVIDKDIIIILYKLYINNINDNELLNIIELILINEVKKPNTILKCGDNKNIINNIIKYLKIRSSLYLSLLFIYIYLPFININNYHIPNLLSINTFKNKIKSILTIHQTHSYNNTQYNPTEIQSNSLPLAESSPPPEVTTLSSTRRGASSNSLPVNGKATPGDRGDINPEEQELPGRTKSVAPKNRNSTRKNKGCQPGGTKNVNPEEHTSSIVDVTSGGLPENDLREFEGEVNGRAVCKTNRGGRVEGSDMTSTGEHNEVTIGMGSCKVLRGEVVVYDRILILLDGVKDVMIDDEEGIDIFVYNLMMNVWMYDDVFTNVSYMLILLCKGGDNEYDIYGMDIIYQNILIRFILYSLEILIKNNDKNNNNELLNIINLILISTSTLIKLHKANKINLILIIKIIELSSILIKKFNINNYNNIINTIFNLIPILIPNNFNCILPIIRIIHNLNNYNTKLIINKLYTHLIKYLHIQYKTLEVTSTNGPTSHSLAESSPPEVSPAVSSPLEVQSNVGPPAVSSSNYLPVNGRATPGDRGEGNDEDDVTSSGLPGRTKNVAPKNRNSTRKNRNNIPGGTKSVNSEEREGNDVTSSGEPAADLREAEGEVKGGGLHGEWTTSGGTASGKDRAVTSGGSEKDISSIDIIDNEMNVTEIVSTIDDISPTFSCISNDNTTNLPDYINQQYLSTEVQSNSPSTRRGASSNYLSLKGDATPGDRGDGDDEDLPGRTKKISTQKNRNSLPGGTKSVNPEEREANDVTSSGLPVADLREAEGQLNKEAVCKTTSGVKEVDWTLSMKELNGRKSPLIYDYMMDVEDIRMKMSMTKLEFDIDMNVDMIDIWLIENFNLLDIDNDRYDCYIKLLLYLIYYFPLDLDLLNCLYILDYINNINLLLKCSLMYVLYESIIYKFIKSNHIYTNLQFIKLKNNLLSLLIHICKYGGNFNINGVNGVENNDYYRYICIVSICNIIQLERLIDEYRDEDIDDNIIYNMYNIINELMNKISIKDKIKNEMIIKISDLYIKIKFIIN